MAEPDPNPALAVSAQRRSAWLSYGAAVLGVCISLSLSSLSAILDRHASALFLVAVLVTARFFGFGPALLSVALSTICLDFFVLPPRFSVLLNEQDLEHLVVFLILAILVGTLVRHRTQAELRAERALREMAAIAEFSEDAIYSSRPDGIITAWNRGAERLYGYTAEEAVGAPVLMLAPPDKADEVRRNQLLLNAGGRLELVHTDRLRKDGTRVQVSASAWPLRNPRGEIIGASAIARDLSVQKQSEEVIRRNEKLAMAGRLAASIAHEINNPLEAILNLLYLARHDPRQAERYLSMAEREVAGVARLAQQTLGFVRETASPSPMNPATLMDEILQLYARKMETKGIEIERRYRDAPRVDGYAGEIRQLLANLLVNAVDAMATGGRLQVRVVPAHNARDFRSGVRITVADNGSGITPDSLRRIFEPFYTTKKDAGTGLGLWVSRGIVERHGGSIRVRSRAHGNPNGHPTGTVFSIFLPIAQPAQQVA